LLEFGEMWVAGDEEIRSGGVRQGNEVIIAGVRGESDRHLGIGFNGA
jgi:hypothetical protein